MSTTNDDIDPRLREALHAYNAPPPAPLDDMWQTIEREHFGATVHRLPVDRRWIPTGLAVAAALVLGIAIGHFSPSFQSAPGPGPVPMQLSPVARVEHDPSARPIDAAYGLAANRYLGQTAALLAVLPGVARIDQQGLAQQVDAHFASQAAELLSTTRMLLASPAIDDPALHDLLSDLELVLAQVASLSPTRTPEELRLISAAVRQHDVMPRLQQAVLRTADTQPGSPGTLVGRGGEGRESLEHSL